MAFKRSAVRSRLSPPKFPYTASIIRVRIFLFSKSHLQDRTPYRHFARVYTESLIKFLFNKQNYLPVTTEFFWKYLYPARDTATQKIENNTA